MAAVILLMLCIAACSDNPSTLRLVTPQSPLDAEIAGDVIQFFGRHSSIRIQMLPGPASDDRALEALADGRADIALVSNNMPYRPGVATVMPLYATVLHIGYEMDRLASNGDELLLDANVFAGVPGSASRLMFERVIAYFHAGADRFAYVDSVGDRPDVVVVFAPISPDPVSRFPNMRIFSLGDPDLVGRGSLVDAITLINPRLRPFVIPVATYGDATMEPTLTVAVDMLLVARADLGASVVYDFVRELLRLRPALSALRPGLFQSLTDEIDSSNSTFVHHPDLIAYTQRNAPSVYERYSGIAEVVETLTIAVISGLFTIARILRCRRKNRIDQFYKQVMTIRTEELAGDKPGTRQDARDRIRELQKTAFEMLVDSKLAADESFRIFITLSNDVLDELGESRT